MAGVGACSPRPKRSRCKAPASTGDWGILRGLGEAAQPLV